MSQTASSRPAASSIRFLSPVPIAALIFLLEVLLSSASLAGFPGPWRYYAFQWTISYGDGFTRRGLLGELLRLLHLDNGSYLLIALCGWAVTLLFFCLIARVLLRLLVPLPAFTRHVLFIALLLSPATTGAIVQTTGDPIQLILLLYLALTLFALQSERNTLPPAISFLVFLIFGAVSILIHEASLFFVGPALLLAAFMVRRSAAGRAALAGYILGALPVLLFTVRWTARHTAVAIAPMHIGSTPMVAHSAIHMDTFGTLLAEEDAAHFHNGIRGYVLTLRNAVGALMVPLFLAIVLSSTLSRSTQKAFESCRRSVLVFLLPLLLSSPLWIIAHDWGRFSTYLFIVSLTLLSLRLPAESSPAPRPSTPAEMPFLLAAILLVLSGITTSHILTNYVLKGLGDDNATFIAGILLCLAGAGVLLRPRAEPSSEPIF